MSFISILESLDGDGAGGTVMFQCSNGEYIPLFKHCDFKSDCSDGSDESICGNYDVYVISRLYLEPQYARNSFNYCN